MTTTIGSSTQVNNSAATQSTQQTQTSSTSSTDTEFKDMMKMMMTMMSMQSMSSGISGSSSSEDSNSMGFDFNSFMMPVMFSMMEKLMAKTVNESQTTTETTSDAKNISSLADAESLQINQFSAEKSVGGDGINSNCGPTSLVMALHALGLKVSGEDSSTNGGKAVELARRSMVADSARDGIDSNGRRSESENNTFTNFTDLMRGAKAAGADAEIIDADSSSIQDALGDGKKVIISGTFSGKYPLPWTGDMGSDSSSAPGNATAHIVAVTGYDSETGNFIVNDPARLSPLEVSASDLDYFMQGNAGAMTVSTD